MKNYGRLTVAACLSLPASVDDPLSGASRMATLGASLLTLFAISCVSLGLWGIAADLDLAGGFVLQSGFLSHWQVWIGAAVGTQYAGVLLNRHAKAPRYVPDDEPIAHISDAPISESATT